MVVLFIPVDGTGTVYLFCKYQPYQLVRENQF